MAELSLPGGARARRVVGGDDYAAIADVFNRSLRSDGGMGMASGSQVENDFTHTPNLDIERGIYLFEADGEAIGYVVARWFQETDGPRIYRHMAKLVTDYRRRGIGTAVLDWAQGYLREIAAGHDVADKEFQTDADDADRGAVVLLTGAGYRPVFFNAQMVRPHLDDIPGRALPDGVEIRAATPEHYRAIWEAEAEAFRDHVGYVEQTEDDFRRFVSDPEMDPTLWKVAWHEDEVVGQVRTFVNAEENEATGRRRGWTEDISTRREWRGRGVAGALICASLRELRELGMEEAALGVHVDNPTGAYRLYEGLGYQVVSSSATYQRPLDG